MERIETIKDLPREHITQLAHLLSLPTETAPEGLWLRDQRVIITALPSTLRRRPSLFSWLATSDPQDKAYLCDAHRSLNAYLIRHIFLLLSAECTIRLTKLVENLLLHTRVINHVRRLHGVNALWMSPGLYHLAFGALPEGVAMRERITSRCEACILAVMGGDAEILSDLRASLRGRKKNGRSIGRFYPLVQDWIKGNVGGKEVYAESKALGYEIVSCRREMQKAREQEKRNALEGGAGREAIPENTM